MAQVAEHVLGKDEVTGSNPVNSSKENPMNARFVGFFFFFAETWKGENVQEMFKYHVKITGKGAKGLVTCFGFKSYHSHTLFL